jgi:hypothetical protein
MIVSKMAQQQLYGNKSIVFPLALLSLLTTGPVVKQLKAQQVIIKTTRYAISFFTIGDI